VLPPSLPRIEAFAMYNREAPIPPQCYTRTEGAHNPCYVCHQDAVTGRENAMNDGGLQAQYSFSDTGATNHWHNLFEDRSARVAKISDAAILEWIDEDNYSELATRLRAAGFQGWIPDLAHLELGGAAFDDEGFARDASGWVAINYKPFPSTFWPTNGSTDDVMIRLPEQFRRDARGRESRDVYRANLALLEMNIKGLTEVSTWPIDERAVGIDLDGDGKFAQSRRALARERYAGAAAQVVVEPTVYPRGTEFLHTVRYLGITADGSIGSSRRMKEVRYMRRWLASTRDQLRQGYENEAVEKNKGELPSYLNFGQEGLATRMGWQLSGFIEDRAGRLRANTYEEQMSAWVATIRSVRPSTRPSASRANAMASPAGATSSCVACPTPRIAMSTAARSPPTWNAWEVAASSAATRRCRHAGTWTTAESTWRPSPRHPTSIH
jgi:hypothetical protein